MLWVWISSCLSFMSCSSGDNLIGNFEDNFVVKENWIMLRLCVLNCSMFFKLVWLTLC